MKLSVKHDSVNQKFLASIAGKECNLRYEKIHDQLWDLKMMFVPKNLRGQGIASKVVEHTLNYAKKNFIKIKVSCSFVKNYMKEHKKFDDVLFKKEHLETV